MQNVNRMAMNQGNPMGLDVDMGMNMANMGADLDMDMNMGNMGMEMGMDMGMDMESGEMAMGGPHSLTCMCEMMKMYFHFGYTEMAVLFQWWSISTVWELLLSMLGLFILSYLYEGLKYYRDHLFRQSVGSSVYTSSSKTDLTIDDGPQPHRMSMFSSGHVIQTLLHVIQFTISYVLMLIFMTYNLWLCFAVLAGSALGYFFFGWRKSVVVDLTEHCH